MSRFAALVRSSSGNSPSQHSFFFFFFKHSLSRLWERPCPFQMRPWCWMCSGLMGMSFLTPLRSFFLPRSFPRHTLTGPGQLGGPTHRRHKPDVTVRSLYLIERSPQVTLIRDQSRVFMWNSSSSTPRVDQHARVDAFILCVFSSCFLCCVCVCVSFLGITANTRTRVPQALVATIFISNCFLRVSSIVFPVFFFSLWIVVVFFIFRSGLT